MAMFGVGQIIGEHHRSFVDREHSPRLVAALLYGPAATVTVALFGLQGLKPSTIRLDASVGMRMIRNMFNRDPQDEADQRRYRDVDVVELVSRVGDVALSNFTDGLRPHLLAVQRGDKDAPQELSRYLHESAVSAAVLLHMGGLDGLAAAEAQASEGPRVTVDDALARFEKLAS